MEAVLEVRAGLVVLKRGAERSVALVSTGILGYALERAKVGSPALQRGLSHAGLQAERPSPCAWGCALLPAW